MTKALILFSGGLDSILAARILLEQKIKVSALTFESNFFNAEKARLGVKALGIPLVVVNISQLELDLVKNPPNGYGKNLNPCIDCHSMMMKLAGMIILKDKNTLNLVTEGEIEEYDFIATGEVLGQRPFSQTKQALRRVAKLSGVEVLRPLSAKLMATTEMEKKGLVKRHLLLDIEGRGRDKQIELAKQFGIYEYPTPAGGCLLTDPGFSEQLSKMLDFWPECTVEDVELLKLGRIFWLDDEQGNKILLIVSRNEEEGEKINKLAKSGDFVVELIETSGPSAIIRSKSNVILANQEVLVPKKRSEIKNDIFSSEGVLKLIAYFAPKARGKKVQFDIHNK